MSKTLTFVACAHNEEDHNLVFIDSMLNQTDQNFKAIVYHNGPNIHMGQLVADKNNGRWTEEDGDHIQFKNSKTDTGCWGCYNREDAINTCDTNYIIQTSVSDYFLPQAVENIQKMLEQDPDICVWNSINHLVGPCQMLDSKLEWSRLDWGNFAIKTSIAKQIGINHKDAYCADWGFIVEVLNSGLLKKILKCNGILTIHN